MFDEIIARYDALALHTFAYTVTMPGSGVLAIEDAARRLGFDPAMVRGHEEPHSDCGLSLYQIGTGIVMFDRNPGGYRNETIDRLAGEGFRHWSLAFDIEGNTSMYVRYGDAEGHLEHPEEIWIPFTHWADHLGPLVGYAELLGAGYDTEDGEAAVDMTSACLAVIELESGVRLDDALIRSSHSGLPPLPMS
ncbi:hypothetical protein [Nonomuraea roseola]|uniref:VOC family protein n=1 Tax=Nonomuraea roseola TaxID=46179 RepID=A0ABV5PTW1_9ACTN